MKLRFVPMFAILGFLAVTLAGDRASAEYCEDQCVRWCTDTQGREFCCETKTVCKGNPRCAVTPDETPWSEPEHQPMNHVSKSDCEKILHAQADCACGQTRYRACCKRERRGSWYLCDPYNCSCPRERP